MSLYSRFAEYYELIFPFRARTFDFLCEHFPPGGHLLDIGCGSGIYAGRLAETGFEVSGTDLDPEMIKAAASAFPAARFQILDMLLISRLTGPFDAAYCIGNVLPHLPSTALPEFLSSLNKIITPGASWVVQTVNFDPLLAVDHYRFPDIFIADEQLVFYREYLSITPSCLKFSTALEKAGKQIFRQQVDLFPVSSVELIELHRQAGFDLVGHWADFKASPFLVDTNSGSVYLFRKMMA